jgi:PTS system mannose-specific IIC component
MVYIFLPALAGLFSMDRLTAFNFMVSRPLVVSAIIGGIGGNLYWCVVGGVFFELVGIMDMPLGTRISTDDTFGAFVHSVCVVYSGVDDMGGAFITALIAFVMIFPATFSINLQRHINGLLLRRNPQKIAELIIFGQLLSFFRGVVVYTFGAVVLIMCYAVLHTYVQIHVTAFAAAPPLMLICGYFAHFFNSPGLKKAALLLTGGVLSWIIW